MIVLSIINHHHYLKSAPTTNHPKSQGPGYQKPKKRNLRNWCNSNYKIVIAITHRNLACVIGVRARQNVIFIERYEL